MVRTSRISCVAYATLDSASEAKIGSAKRFFSSVCPAASELIGGPMMTRFRTRVMSATGRTVLRRARGRLTRTIRAVHIVIMGCGRVGAALAHQLAPLDHTISVIDQDRLAFRRLGDDFPGTTVTGIGF